MTEKQIVILCGIPCSGKTHSIGEIVSKYLSLVCGNKELKVLSKDHIRDRFSLKSYDFESESKVTQIYERFLNEALEDKNVCSIILDNTHCSTKQLRKLVNNFERDGHYVKIVFYDCSLIKAYYRNIVRFIETKVWTPVSFINRMHKNYKSIEQEEFGTYILELK